MRTTALCHAGRKKGSAREHEAQETMRVVPKREMPMPNSKPDGNRRGKVLSERNTHTFIVLQGGALQDEKPCLPSTEVLTAFGKITLLISCLGNGFCGVSYDVRGEERDDLVLVLDGEGDDGPQVLFECSLRNRKESMRSALSLLLGDAGEDVKRQHKAGGRIRTSRKAGEAHMSRTYGRHQICQSPPEGAALSGPATWVKASESRGPAQSRAR